MRDEKADESWLTFERKKRRIFKASWSVCEHENICFIGSASNLIWTNGSAAGSGIEDSKGSLNIKNDWFNQMKDAFRFKIYHS